ncbi:hypothetical protein LINGRAHAP2_LOCUS26887 [Linum grandiflorum]
MGHFALPPSFSLLEVCHSHDCWSLCESFCCEHGELLYYSSGDASDCRRITTGIVFEYLPDTGSLRLEGGRCYFC